MVNSFNHPAEFSPCQQEADKIRLLGVGIDLCVWELHKLTASVK